MKAVKDGGITGILAGRDGALAESGNTSERWN
jgi:hypothetical protein